MKPLRILYVAYPLQAVSDASCGGAEQMLHLLDAGMAARGHETHLAAQASSRVAGRLLVAADAPRHNDDIERLTAQMIARVVQYVRDHHDHGTPFDLIHDASGLFWRQYCGCPILSEAKGGFKPLQLQVPLLLTAHLPRDFYGDALRCLPPDVTVNCVSETQRRTFNDVSVSATIPNGITLERFPLCTQKGDYLLWLGRICEEKGAHTAIAVARAAALPLVLAGEVYPFSYHENYFRREVKPHLEGARVRLVRSPNVEQKVDLLRHARALLIPSTAAETSSLVAMEAAACGTPVVAFASGALPEVVQHGVTGWIVNDESEMAAAVARVPQLNSQNCRRIAEARFGAVRMLDEYEQLYSKVIARRSERGEGTAA